MNGYQTQAAHELTEVMRRLPMAHKLTYQCRGIVGGDFDVIVKRIDRDSRKTSFQQLEVTINER